MNAMEVARLKTNTLQRINANRQQIRSTVDKVEILAGAALAGALAAKQPDIGGVPTEAALGLVLATAGMALNQRDAAAAGVGMLAYYVGKTVNEKVAAA